MAHHYLISLTDKNAKRLDDRWQGGKAELVIGPQCRGVPIATITDMTPEKGAGIYTEEYVQDALAEAEKRHAEGIARMEALHQREIVELRHQIELEFEKKKRQLRKDNAAASRTALVAKISEHVAPLLPDFPYNFKEVRHVGELFDFLCFVGLEAGFIEKVVFLEVKTKKSGGRVTNPREQLLRDAIRSGRVGYEVFIPEVNGAKDA